MKTKKRQTLKATNKWQLLKNLELNHLKKQIQ